MLAGLARWLRVLDVDTLFEPQLDDPDQVRLAVDQQRILLTRDRHLVRTLKPPQVLLIVEDAPLRQLRQVIEQAPLLPPSALFARCLVCNSRLREASDEETTALAPLSAQQRGDRILRCPGCARIYWQGSHTRRMRRQLAEALPEWFAQERG